MSATSSTNPSSAPVPTSPTRPAAGSKKRKLEVVVAELLELGGASTKRAAETATTLAATFSTGTTAQLAQPAAARYVVIAVPYRTPGSSVKRIEYLTAAQGFGTLEDAHKFAVYRWLAGDDEEEGWLHEWKREAYPGGQG